MFINYVVLFDIFSFSAIKTRKRTVQLSNFITWFHLDLFIPLQKMPPLRPRSTVADSGITSALRHVMDLMAEV